MYKEIIATLDIGSSKITIAGGKKDSNGMVSIAAIEKESTNSSVRRGRIYNVSDISNKIQLLSDRLNEKLNDKIAKIYVGVNGQSLRTETYFVSRQIGGAVVDEQLLASLREQCEAYQPDEISEVLDVVSLEYFLDGKPEKNPIGVSCDKIEVRYQLILGNHSIKLNLINCVTKNSEIEIAGYFIGPIATATAVLSDSEKNLGCALIEFGADITYLSVYKAGLLKYLISIPLGGNAITKDICDLKILEEEAENLKITYGTALVELEDENNPVKNIKLQNSSIKEIDAEQLNDVIEARTDEIIANIKNLLEINNLSDCLENGIIITGGMAALKNLDKSIEKKLNKKVRVAHVKRELLDEDSLTFGKIFGNEATIGLLSLGTKNCVKENIVNPPQGQSSLFSPDEILVVDPPKKERGKRKPPVEIEEEKEEIGLFGKITKKIASNLNKVSKDVLGSADATEEKEEEEGK